MAVGAIYLLLLILNKNMYFLCPSKVYKEQLKRESVLTAKAIINNDTVKIRYEKYIKVNDAYKYLPCSI